MGGWFRVSPDGPPNLTLVLCTAGEIASGMAHLHSRGIVHGDLSSGAFVPSKHRWVLACQELSTAVGYSSAKTMECGSCRALMALVPIPLCNTARVTTVLVIQSKICIAEIPSLNYR